MSSQTIVSIESPCEGSISLTQGIAPRHTEEAYPRCKNVIAWHGGE
jgi:hypothetical protein